MRASIATIVRKLFRKPNSLRPTHVCLIAMRISLRKLLSSYPRVVVSQTYASPRFSRKDDSPFKFLLLPVSLPSAIYSSVCSVIAPTMQTTPKTTSYQMRDSTLRGSLESNFLRQPTVNKSNIVITSYHTRIHLRVSHLHNQTYKTYRKHAIFNAWSLPNRPIGHQSTSTCPANTLNNVAEH